MGPGMFSFRMLDYTYLWTLLPCLTTLGQYITLDRPVPENLLQ